MENPQDRQPKVFHQQYQYRNHNQSNHSYQNHGKQQSWKNDDKVFGKKGRGPSERHNQIQNHKNRCKESSDGSVNANSHGESSTGGRNISRSNFSSDKRNHTDGWKHSGKSRKGHKNELFRNNRQLYEEKQRNSVALKSYLRQRGWSLTNDHNNSNEKVNQTDANNTTLATYPVNDTIGAFVESEMVRKKALKLLENTLCRWATSIEKNPIAWKRVQVTLVTFGSYRLRAYRPDADVDLLAICPPFCTRNDFFTSLVDMMKGESAITHIHPIASAFTPVIKFTIHNIHFDMLFGRATGKANIEKLINYQKLSLFPSGVASMNITRKTGSFGTASFAEAAMGKGAIGNKNTTTKTEDLLHEFKIDDSFLTGMEDDSEIRSANGVRVTQFILEYVPNQDAFRLVICAVKEWAMLQGIYSNVLGFLGGVNWAIMVAFVCKQNPTQPPSTLLSTFFKVFATWNWPDPVLLLNTDKQVPRTIAGMKPWDPKTNPRDARHVMPIITPVFPRMNSSYNIAIPQQRRIQEELTRAAFITQDENNWRALYNRNDFFERHANFLQITIRAGNNHGEFTKWLRLCESRLRLLVNALDCEEMSVWPFAQIMERKFKSTPMDTTPAKASNECAGREALFFIALRFAPNVECIDLKHRTSEFLINQINSWEGRKPNMDFMIHHLLQKDLPHQLIGEYVATKPSPYSIPNPKLFNTISHKILSQNGSLPANTMTKTAVASPISKRNDNPPIPKNIRRPSGGDTQSLGRSTYSSIARSVNSSMRSVDGTETSLDGIEPESRPHSPLGNFITVEGGPSMAQANDEKKKNQTISKDIDGCDNTAKPSSHQSQLYDFLTGKIDDILPVNSADESCTQSDTAESQSDQSSTRSPIKKRQRNNSQA